MEEEDRRRLTRERRRLVTQRTRPTNSIKGRLMLHGVFDLDPRSAEFPERLDSARTGYRAPLPPGTRAEARRAKALLEVVEGQIAEIESERDRIVERARSVTAVHGGADRGPDAMIARLVRLHGVGPNDAVVLAHEVFCREFRNRRQLAGWACLAPAPWASGKAGRVQGIDKSGPPWVRALLVQLAWRWLRYQPESERSRWFRVRAGGSEGRMRGVLVIALARKLLVALWRHATMGVVPGGARLA